MKIELTDEELIMVMKLIQNEEHNWDAQMYREQHHLVNVIPKILRNRAEERRPKVYLQIREVSNEKINLRA